MNTNDEFSFERIKATQTRVGGALEVAEATNAAVDVTEALLECRDLLNALNTQYDTTNAEQEHADFLPWTFDDDSIAPFGREFDVRLYYDWETYCPGDRVTPADGGSATLSNVELVAVRYTNEQGQEISLGRYHADVAWYLAEMRRESLEEACTAAGVSRGVGETHSLFTSTWSDPPAEQPSTRRMAQSARKRSPKGDQKLG